MAAPTRVIRRDGRRPALPPGQRSARSAEDLAAGFDTVADHPTPAVCALRRQRVDRALEGIERAGAAPRYIDGHRLVVVVAAQIASRHEVKAIDDVGKYGWHCVLVADEHHPEHADLNAALGPHEVYDAAFAYTVGVWRTFEHPELTSRATTSGSGR